MDKETIKDIVMFLQRINLSATEVPAFTKAINELNKEFNKIDLEEHQKASENVEQVKDSMRDFVNQNKKKNK